MLYNGYELFVLTVTKIGITKELRNLFILEVCGQIYKFSACH